MSTLIIIAFILGGLILFAVEVFLVPGISLAGIGATLCILYAIFYAFVYVGTTAGWISVTCSALGIALVTVWFMRSKTVDRLALKKTLDYKPDPLKGLDLKAGDTGTTVTRLTLIGNADFAKLSAQNAFLAAESLRKKAEEENASLVVYFHAATTAEKNTMLCFLDGKAVAVVGTHTKVLTADAHVTENGTAYITDTGRVGSFMSVSGFEPETEIRKIKGGIPIRSHEAWLDGRIEGLLVRINEDSLKATEAIAIDEKVEIRRPEEKD